MYKILPLLCIMILPGWAAAQQKEEDPFKRDPIFTKSLEELLGIDEEGEESVREQTRRETRPAANHVSVDGIDLGGGFEAGPYYSNALYSRYPNLPGIRYNRVNGLFLGLKKERMQWYRYGNFLNIPQIQPHGFIGYGTASKEWEYAIGAEKLIGRDRRVMIGGEYHRAAATEDYERVGLIESSLTSFFASYDFLDYYKMEGFGFYGAFRTQRWFEAGFSYNRDTFSTIERNTTWSLFGRSSIVRPSPVIDEFSDEINLDIYAFSAAFNPRNALLTPHFTFSASAKAELADNAASDRAYRYNKYQTTLKLFYNFEPGSVLRWRVHAGGITGYAPDFKSFYLGGIGTLRGTPYKFFQGNQMLASNLEIQFGRPSPRSGEWFRYYNLHFLLFLDSGWTHHVPALMDSSNPFEGFREFSLPDMQHDAGIGLGTGGFRAELAWPLKEFGRSPVFWIRFNPTF